ncbi:MAG: rRNA maturation RNase YbeY [Campylobacterota bacterium]
MIEFDNLTQYDLDISLLEKISESLSQNDIELVLCDDLHIQKLNLEYRGKDKPTDVLSFPLEQMPNTPLGTVVINLDKARDTAQELGHDIDAEITLLFIHGVLHLLGYDHESDSGQMRQKEMELIAKFALPASLIIRNS